MLETCVSIVISQKRPCKPINRKMVHSPALTFQCEKCKTFCARYDLGKTICE